MAVIAIHHRWQSERQQSDFLKKAVRKGGAGCLVILTSKYYCRFGGVVCRSQYFKEVVTFS